MCLDYADWTINETWTYFWWSISVESVERWVIEHQWLKLIIMHFSGLGIKQLSRLPIQK